MKIYPILAFSLLIFSCQPGTNKDASKDVQSIDPCARINEALNGTFATKYMDGTMVWKGGTTGTVDISGVDYHDITCTYSIPDCTQNVITMNCEGAPYETEFILYSIDSFQLGPSGYHRVR